MISYVQQAQAGILIYGCGANATSCTLEQLEQGGNFFINEIHFSQFSGLGQLNHSNVIVTPVAYNTGSGITSAFYVGFKMTFDPSLTLASSGTNIQSSFDTGYTVSGNTYLDNAIDQVFIGANTGLCNNSDYRVFLATPPLGIGVVCSDINTCPNTSPLSNTSISSPSKSFSVFNYLDVRGPAEVTGFETVFQVVPEPATLALMSIGLAGIGIGRLRK